MPRTGLVVSGAGARGAYEAGALSVLVPSLDEAPSVLVGTSAGALNAVALAAGVPAEQLVGLWGEVSLGDVVDLTGTLAGGLSYAASVAGLPTRPASLLDTSPQRATLERLLPVADLRRAVAEGPVDAVAVVTTSVETGGTVVFVEKKASVPLPPPDEDRAITYVACELTVEHVLASAAVPVAFRPVFVSTPQAWRGWYVDGGLRLNTPLKPALDLGARRLAVVATQPASYAPQVPTGPGRAPDARAVAALLLRALLGDRMVEDLRTLSQVNRLLGTGRVATQSRAARGRPPYRSVPFRFVGPGRGQQDDLARLAARSYVAAYGGLKALRNPPLAALERLLGGAPEDSGELLSYLFFDPAFTRPAAGLGAAHARAADPRWTVVAR